MRTTSIAYVLRTCVVLTFELLTLDPVKTRNKIRQITAVKCPKTDSTQTA